MYLFNEMGLFSKIARIVIAALDKMNLKGYRISFYDRDTIRYFREGYVAIIGAELDLKGPQRIVYASLPLRWEEPNQNEVITPEEKRIIIQRVCEFLSRKNISYSIR